MPYGIDHSSLNFFQVPAISDVNQAAQVTAYDAALGRLSVGGRQIGDTGWRAITPINGWSGTFHIRRTGDVVHVRTDGTPMSDAAATDHTLYNLPVGFRVGSSNTHYSFIPAANDTGADPATLLIRLAHSMQARWTVGTRTSLRFGGTWTTTDAWPVSLPGVAA